MAIITKNHIIFNLLNIVRGGQQANSEYISEDQVSFWSDNTRTKLIRQDLNKGRTLNPDLVQSLGCVDVEIADASECPCIATGCSTVRTKLEIPPTIETAVKNLITRVGPIHSEQIAWSQIPYHAAAFQFNNPFSKKTVKWYLHNNKIHVMGPDVAELLKINIQGVFERPEDISPFKTCSGDTCYSKESRYPIPSWMIEDMTKMILDANFRIAATAPTDKTADASHNVSSNIVNG